MKTHKVSTTARFTLLCGLGLLLSVAPATAGTTKKKGDHNSESAAQREARIAIEKKIKEKFSYSFKEVADYLVIITHERAVGSGFIAKMDGKYYIITNQHVILGADQIRFTTATGKKLAPRRVELSATRDIARLELDTDAGLELADDVEMDSPIAVFGNSEGAGVATELYGRINGIGAEVIEVSADFVSGNSGSPVLDLNQKIVGIASYVKYSRPSEMKEGTKFENRTRRFCYRLTGTEWMSVNWKKYNETYGGLYRSTEELIDSIVEVIGKWADDPFGKLTVQNHPDRDLNKWSEAHNLMVNRIIRLNDQGRATQHELDNTNKQIRKDIQDSAESLSHVCKKRAKQTALFATQRGLTEFLRKEFEGYALSLEYIAKNIDEYGDNLSTINYFSFREGSARK